MSFEEVASLDADNTVALGGKNKQTGKPNPTSAEGYYLGSRKVDSRKAKTGFAYIHIFQTPKGNLGVWGKTDLDRKILLVTPGTMTRVVFDGMRATPNGEMYKYKVSVDKTNSIEISLQSEVYSETVSEPVQESFDSNDSDDNETDADEDAAALAAIAARKAKVQEVLSRKKA